jgi:heme/copper-type cytochrome/quinol oxidase subunit 4
MERAANIPLSAWSGAQPADRTRVSVRVFASVLITSACVSAALASWLPLQVSIATVFLFAGPHNWFEARYFLMRLPARFGRSRNFFAVAFAGIFVLTVAYVSLPVLYYTNVWSASNWPTAIAGWNTLLLLWLGVLVLLRGKQSSRRDWFWALPVTFALCAVNWLAPDLFSLAIVYLHPLVALWFLDRHLKRTRPEWLRTYRRCLILLPLLLAGMLAYLARTPSLADDNGLFWRITQHAGAELLPNVSSHLLVSTHVFLELLHYGIWIVALPLIGATGAVWSVNTIPLARRRRGWPKLIGAVLVCGLFVVALLWLGFSTNYPVTRDVYFAVAIAHVMAEAPFLLRMI